MWEGKHVARLMREMGLQGVCPRKFRVTTDSDHEHPLAENVLARNFEAKAPNEKCVFRTIVNTHFVLS